MCANPDYFEANEHNVFVNCDLCQKEVFFREVGDYTNMEGITILICSDCMNKIENNEKIEVVSDE